MGTPKTNKAITDIEIQYGSTKKATIDGTINFIEWANNTKNGKYKDDVTDYRNTKAEAKKMRNSGEISEDTYKAAYKGNYLKATMPHCVIPSNRRKLKDKTTDLWIHDLWNQSGMIHIDLDNIEPKDMGYVRKQLLSTSPVLLYVSPSGDGIKAFYQFDVTINLPNEYFRETLRHWIRKTLSGLSLGQYYDSAPTNPNSTCYNGYDPDAYIDLSAPMKNLKDTYDWIIDNETRLEAHRKAKAAIYDKAKQVTDTVSKDGLQSRREKIRASNDITTANKRQELYQDMITKGSKSRGDRQAYSLASSMASRGYVAHEIESELISFHQQCNGHWNPQRKTAEALQSACFSTFDANLGYTIDQNGNGSRISSVLTDEEQSRVDQLDIDSNIITELLKSNTKPENIKTTPVLGDSSQRIRIKNALPGVGKSYLETEHIAKATGKQIFIYATHDTKSFNNRSNDIELHCKKHGTREPNIYRVYSGEDRERITDQFEDITTQILGNDKSVIFITHAALEILDFNKLEKLKNIYQIHFICDEVPEVITTNSERYNMRDLLELCSYVEAELQHEENSYLLLVKDISKKGYALINDPANRINHATKEKYKVIKGIQDKINSGLYIEIVKPKDKNNTCITEIVSEKIQISTNENKVRFCRILNVDNLSIFHNVTILGDSAHKSVFALLLQRCFGVEFEIEHIKADHINISNRIDNIYYLTKQTYSAEKAKVNAKLLTNMLAQISANTRYHKNSLMLFNNHEIQERGTCIQHLNDAKYKTYDLAKNRNDDKDALQGIDVVYGSPKTHGMNSLVERQQVAMLYSMKPNPLQQHFMEQYGIEREELTEWQEFNNHIQNAFRAFLRLHNADTVGELVFTDKASVDYFIQRIHSEFGEHEAKLCRDKVKYIGTEEIEGTLSPKKAGRKTTGDRAMTKYERNKLSRWRTELGDNVDRVVSVYGIDKTLSMKKKELTKIIEAGFPEAANDAISTATVTCIAEVKEAQAKRNAEVKARPSKEAALLLEKAKAKAKEAHTAHELPDMKQPKAKKEPIPLGGVIGNAKCKTPPPTAEERKKQVEMLMNMHRSA